MQHRDVNMEDANMGEQAEQAAACSALPQAQAVGETEARAVGQGRGQLHVGHHLVAAVGRAPVEIPLIAPQAVMVEVAFFAALSAFLTRVDLHTWCWRY